MQKKEFIRQLNELVPRPDPVTTEALYRFDRECAESEYMDMLTALRVVARNFSEETLQSAYEIIQNQNAALPSELFAAAVYFQAGRTPAEVSGLAKEGRLMGFFGPERPEEPSRIATCTIVESGREQRFYTMDFGRFNPQHALKRAITYSREAGISATQAMARLTMDQPEFAEKPGGPRCILNGLGKDAALIISRINGFTYVQTEFDYASGELKIVKETPYSKGLRAKVRCYGVDDVREGVAVMHKEGVDVSITGNSTNPTRFQHPVAGTYKKECYEQNKKYFSVASGGGTGRTLHPDNMAAGPASYGMTDTMGRMHSDAQFAGSSSVPAHVEMMGFLGMGNNPMVGATVAVAVAVEQAMK